MPEKLALIKPTTEGSTSFKATDFSLLELPLGGVEGIKYLLTIWIQRSTQNTLSSTYIVKKYYNKVKIEQEVRQICTEFATLAKKAAADQYFLQFYNFHIRKSKTNPEEVDIVLLDLNEKVTAAFSKILYPGQIEGENELSCIIFEEELRKALNKAKTKFWFTYLKVKTKEILCKRQ